MFDKPFFQSLKWPLIGSAILGCALFAYGLSIPPYSDMALAAQLNLDACDENGVIEGWYDQKSALETWRYPLMNGGISVVLGAVTISAIVAAFAQSSRVSLQTPSQKATFFGLGALVFGLSWSSQIWSLGLDQGRGVFPYCADSIGIPMGFISLSHFFLFGLSIVVGLVLALGFRKLPVDLFAWRSDRPVRSTLITIPLALFAIIIALLGLLTATSSAFLGTPAFILALYLTEATRSALVK